MKNIINLILKDIASSRRDNIILYMLISPILIAVIMRFFIPSFESSSITFAINAKNNNLVQQVESYGKVITFINEKELEERVQQNDDVIGIIEEGGEYRIILEGNEKKEMGEAAYVILDNIQRENNLAEYEFSIFGDKR